MHHRFAYLALACSLLALSACGVKGALERPEQAVATPKVSSSDIPPPPGQGREQPDVRPETQVERMREMQPQRGVSW